MFEPKTAKSPAWRDFEAKVADIFRLYGFWPSRDTVIAGRQVDILLTSSEEFVGPIIVECKYHIPGSKAQVGVQEVESFSAFVLRLRNSGTASAGYLVTNTGFTAPATGMMRERPEGTFVFLRTVDELLRRIVRFDAYLGGAVDHFERDPLYRVYEPIAVRRLNTKVPEDFDATVDTFLSDSDCSTLLLLGDYGTGKTSSCRHLFYRLARLSLERNAGRIPLYIPLKSFNYTGTPESLINKFLAENLALSRPTYAVFEALNKAGLLFLILDGFDEMARRVTRRVRDEAFRCLGALVHQNSKVLISGRPAYFPHHKELISASALLHGPSASDLLAGQLAEDAEFGSKVQIICIEPFSDVQIASFLIKRLGHSGVSRRAVQDRSTQILSTIKNVYNLNELARRPILLEMIFRTIDKLGSKNIRTATDLYRLYTDAWLNIEIEKGEFRTLLSKEDRLVFTLKLSWLLILNRTQDMHYSVLGDFVSRHFELDEAEDVDQFSSDVRTCSFLERTDDGRYSFAHKSFLEYFGARSLAAQLGLEDIDVEFEEAGEVTLRELEAYLPGLFAFLNDLLGFPLSPAFWADISEELLKHPELIDVAPNAEAWPQMAEELSDDDSVLDLTESLDVVRDMYTGMQSAVASAPGRYQRLEGLLKSSMTWVRRSH